MVALAASFMAYRQYPRLFVSEKDTVEEAVSPPTVELCTDRAGALRVPVDVMEYLRIRTEPVVSNPTPPPLRLLGSLSLDSNRLAHVRSRFEGEIVAIGMTDDDDARASGSGALAQRALRYGDQVKQGQLLAVLWSKEVGEKKSELVDALSRMQLDKTTLERLKSLKPGVIAEKVIREAERDYEVDVIAVDRIERTLRSWRLDEAEIEETREEAERLHKEGPGKNPRNAIKVDRKWAELEIKAPFDGVILEKNVVPGDIIKTDLDLFKIGDLRRLTVLANVYEEDLPTLASLRGADRRWSIRLTSQPNSTPIDGMFDLIGEVIDPAQHTATVRGWVDNQDGHLRVGQFISATIDLPVTDDGEVGVPATALIEEGDDKFVFVAEGADENEFVQRRVQVVRRSRDMVFLRGAPTSSSEDAPLRQGDIVVTSGAVLLTSTLAELRVSSAKAMQR
ncbi:MAG: efflux RND transporter periplasmic adaptor subunit [Pirellulales bacterium]